MKPLKTFVADKHTPSDEEIQEAVIYANTKDCVVLLYWVNIGNYLDHITIHPGNTFEEAKNAIPTIVAL